MRQHVWLRRVEDAAPHFSHGQRKIARLLTEHEDAAFLTAAKLAQRAGLSESTVVRFARMLGYEGYPEMQKSLQEMIHSGMTASQRLAMTDESKAKNIFTTVLRADTANIRSTLEQMDPALFDSAVDALLSARRIYVLGLRSSALIAQYLYNYLNYIFDEVVLVTGINDVLEQLVRIEQGDLLVGISFPRYSARTLEGMRLAQERGARVMCLTDSVNSPLAEGSDPCLVAHTNIPSFADSLVAPLSLINALIAAVGLRRRGSIEQHLARLEEAWARSQTYMDRRG